MKSPQRGAARISVVWMITMVVLFFVAFGLAVVAYTDQADAKEQLDVAVTEQTNAQNNLQETVSKHSALSRAIGWYDDQAPVPEADPAAIRGAVAETVETFGLKEDVTTVEDLLPQVRQDHNTLVREVAALRQRVQAVETEKASSEEALRSALTTKDGENQDLRRELADERSAAQERQSELEAQVADLRARNNELDAEKRQQAAEFDDSERGFRNALQTAKTRMDAQGRKLAVFEKAPNMADGKVLEVSEDVDLGWIDIGANQRLAVGTRFTIVSGTPGSDRIKGWAEVAQVEANMAQILITNQADRFDPVVAGDLVFNPLYDPKGGRHAVLAGRFSGQFNVNELGQLLTAMNITVQKQLDELTDFLIVGSELYRDPETGEPLEDPMPASELAVYKDAEAMGGVSIVPLKDIRAYFKF